jgi:Ca-activated chloride channel family protein
MKHILIVLCIALCAGWIDPFRGKVAEGNEAYHDKQYQQAAKNYNEAEPYAPNDEARKKLAFNKAAADYMKGDYESAIALYNEAAASDDPETKKKAFFNMGNAYVKIDKKKEAFESYMNALKIDPGYVNAKKNIEYLLKKDENKENKGNKENNNDNKDQNERNKNDRDKKDGKNNNDGKQQQEQINMEQIKNLLESMKNKPVQRSKANGKRRLEKDW